MSAPPAELPGGGDTLAARPRPATPPVQPSPPPASLAAQAQPSSHPDRTEDGYPTLDDREGWHKLYLPAHTSNSFAEHFWALPTPESEASIAALRREGKAVCRYIGCTNIATQLCQACKDRGREPFSVCSLQCLQLEWERHQDVHTQPLLPPDQQDVEAALAAESNRLLGLARRVDEEQRHIQRPPQASLTEALAADEEQVQRLLSASRVRFGCVQNPFRRAQFLRVLDRQWAKHHTLVPGLGGSGRGGDGHVGEEEEVKRPQPPHVRAPAAAPVPAAVPAVPPQAVPVSPKAVAAAAEDPSGPYPVWNNSENQGRDWLFIGNSAHAMDARLLSSHGISHLVNVSSGHPDLNIDEIIKVVKNLRLHYSELPSVHSDAALASSSNAASAATFSFLDPPAPGSVPDNGSEPSVPGYPVLPKALRAAQAAPVGVVKAGKKSPRPGGAKAVLPIGELSDRVQQLWSVLVQCQQTDGRALIFTADPDLGEPAGVAASFIMFQAKWPVPRIARHLLRERGCLTAVPPEPYLQLLDRFQYSLLMQSTSIRDAVASPDGQVLMDSGFGDWQPVLRGDGAPIGSQDPEQLARGVVKLAVWFDSKRNLVCLRVLQAVALDRLNNSPPDPLVRASWSPGHHLLPSQKTKAPKKTRDPVWNQTLAWEVGQGYARRCFLHLEILDHGLLGSIGFLPFKHRDLGCIQLSLANMPVDRDDCARWYAVAQSPPPEDVKQMLAIPPPPVNDYPPEPARRGGGRGGSRPATPRGADGGAYR